MSEPTIPVCNLCRGTREVNRVEPGLPPVPCPQCTGTAPASPPEPAACGIEFYDDWICDLPKGHGPSCPGVEIPKAEPEPDVGCIVVRSGIPLTRSEADAVVAPIELAQEWFAHCEAFDAAILAEQDPPTGYADLMTRYRDALAAPALRSAMAKLKGSA